jgi:AICAR transformylase/IMP cyclohydrolase PurH/REP element-mobilizing transposase RayT
MPDTTKIRRALISVYDKTGVVEFARALHDEFGIEIISTGGTAKKLTDAGIPVTLVEQITGFPEMMDGRVKTLHPKIHAAILADRDNPEHMRQLAEQGIEPIDMVVVNLYPFEETIARPDCTFEQAIEMIDIGGPCLLRAAAKNHRHVLAICDPGLFELCLTELRQQGNVGQSTRQHLANTVYFATSQYDEEIDRYLAPCADIEETQTDARIDRGQLPAHIQWSLGLLGSSRYGENPHQIGGLYQPFTEWSRDSDRADLTLTKPVKGEMSFNNYHDASAALELCAELTRAGQHLWDRFSTGHSPAKPAEDSKARHISDEHLTRRHLPHIQRPEATYFLTFRVRHGELAPTERDITLSACTFLHKKKMTLHAACVMPDHVHLLLTPHELAPDQWVSLRELLHSIKRYSAREINKARGTQGPLWLDESFDRVIRDEQEFIEKWEYIEANPVTSELVENPRDYRWFWCSEAGFGEVLASQEKDRLQTGPTAAACFIKHTNACGVAVDADPVEAYRKAYLGDPNAAMGGILAVNFAVNAEFAEAVVETYQRWGKPLKEAGHPGAPGAFFIEVWLAPSFDEEAMRIIRGEVEGKPQKAWGKRVRLLDVGDMGVEPDPEEMDLKRIAGGVLMQSRDLVGLNEEQWKVVTKRQPSEQEMADLRLAWLICKHTKSNAITVCKDGMLIGNGAGQMSRVMSGRIATWLAKENGHEEQLKGAVAASDAFFPFRDGPDALIDAGVTALIQPGGSKRDEEVVAACDEHNVAMIFTGTRHFKH